MRVSVFDGLSHGSWVTNWHLFLVVPEINKNLGVFERTLIMSLPNLQPCMFHVFNTLSNSAYASRHQPPPRRRGNSLLFCDPHEPAQGPPLTNRVSHRAQRDPGERLSTPISSPRGATPTHGCRWGISRRPLPNLQTTETTGFSPAPGRQPLLDRTRVVAFRGVPWGPIPYVTRQY
jgi:hypothetical protein